MNTYSSYKDSGIEWIGEIPSEWNIVKTKYMTSPRKELSDSGKEELLSVSEYLGVIPRSVIRKGKGSLSRSESLIGYLKVYKGDLVNNIMLMWKKGLGVSQYDGIVSPAYSVFNFIESVPSYYHYLYRTDRYITEFRKNSTGVIMSRLRLYDDDFGDIPSVIPPLQEQQQIVDYLDKKTSKIDKLIEKTEQKIELLKEQRTSLINTTVTKGLDPNVEMKDSGVDWIGEIPSGWILVSIKRLCSIKRGSSPRPIDNPDYFDVNGEFSWVRIADVSSSERYLENTKQQLSELGSSLSTKRYPGDLFLSIAGTVGKPIITKIKCCIHDGFVWFDGLSINQEFLYYVFSVGQCFKGLGKMGTQLNLNTDTVGLVKIPLMDIQEQQEIVDYLDKETSKIDKLVDIESKRIILLKEYRQTLISEVVTGKVDVRNEVLV